MMANFWNFSRNLSPSSKSSPLDRDEDRLGATDDVLKKLGAAVEENKANSQILAEALRSIAASKANKE